VGKIAEKAVCRSEFLTWHCIFSAKLTKTHSIRLFFFLAILPTGYLAVSNTVATNDDLQS